MEYIKNIYYFLKNIINRKKTKEIQINSNNLNGAKIGNNTVINVGNNQKNTIEGDSLEK